MTVHQHNKRVGEHITVSNGDGGNDSGGGSWSSEVGGTPPAMPGMAALATVPASGWLMMLTACRRWSAATAGGGVTTATAEWLPIKQGDG